MNTTKKSTRSGSLAVSILALLLIAQLIACTSGGGNGAASCDDIAIALAELRVANVTKSSVASNPGHSADGLNNDAKSGPKLSEEEAVHHAKQIAQAIGPRLRETCISLTSNDRSAVHSCLTEALETARLPAHRTSAPSSSSRCLALR